MVVHLGAFKSQLVATIVPYIYIYLGLVWLCMYGIQFPTDPMKDQFLSSVCTCANCIYMAYFSVNVLKHFIFWARLMFSSIVDSNDF